MIVRVSVCVSLFPESQMSAAHSFSNWFTHRLNPKQMESAHHWEETSLLQFVGARLPPASSSAQPLKVNIPPRFAANVRRGVGPLSVR